MIEYVIGDATKPVGEGPKIIAHVCNDVGGWGAGFTGALSQRWTQPELSYRNYSHTRHFRLGGIQYVPVGERLWVANMVAQHGYSAPGKPSIRYYALMRTLRALGTFAQSREASVHMPRIGCGLAGGDWVQIEPIIEGELCARGIAVTVYDLH